MASPFFKSLKAKFAPAVAGVKGVAANRMKNNMQENDEPTTVKKREPIQASSARKFKTATPTSSGAPPNKMSFGRPRRTMFGG